MKALLHILSIILSLTVFYSSVRVGVYFSYYLINPIGFEAKFCKNKLDISLECHGKCKLTEISQDIQNQYSDFDFTQLINDFHWVNFNAVFYFIPLKNEKAIQLFFYKVSHWENVFLNSMPPPWR